MLRPQDDIYVTLPSNVPGVPGNKPSNYKTVLPTPLKLNGAWEVALLETHFPHQMPNFKATTLVVIATEAPQGDQPNPSAIYPPLNPLQMPPPNPPQALQSPMSQSYWQSKPYWQPQPPRGKRDYVDGHRPSDEEPMGDEELVNDQNAESPPQPQTAAPKEDEKKSEPAKPEKPAVEKPKEEIQKPDDAKKPKIDENADKKTKEDADKKAADDLLAQQKAAADLAAKKAEDKRQDDLNKHPTQPLFMLTQAGVKMMKDDPDLGKNGKVIFIPGL